MKHFLCFITWPAYLSYTLVTYQYLEHNPCNLQSCSLLQTCYEFKDTRYLWLLSGHSTIIKFEHQQNTQLILTKTDIKYDPSAAVSDSLNFSSGWKQHKPTEGNKRGQCWREAGVRPVPRRCSVSEAREAWVRRRDSPRFGKAFYSRCTLIRELPRRQRTLRYHLRNLMQLLNFNLTFLLDKNNHRKNRRL